MINSLWISKTGMEAQQTQLDVISHNLANVSTTGYKRANAVFEDLMYQNLRQVGANTTEQSQLPTGLQLGLGVRTVATSRIVHAGQHAADRQPARRRHQGQRLLPGARMPDGTIGYTRDGSFQVDAQGRLVTSTGLPVANGITVPANATNVSIAHRRHGHGHVSGPDRAAADRHARAGQLRQSGRPGAAGPEPLSPRPPPRASRNGGTPGTNGLGTVHAGLPGDLERQRGAGTGRHDPDPARLRDELEGDPDLATRCCRSWGSCDGRSPASPSCRCAACVAAAAACCCRRLRARCRTRRRSTCRASRTAAASQVAAAPRRAPATGSLFQHGAATGRCSRTAARAWSATP